MTNLSFLPKWFWTVSLGWNLYVLDLDPISYWISGSIIYWNYNRVQTNFFGSDMLKNWKPACNLLLFYDCKYSNCRVQQMSLRAINAY